MALREVVETGSSRRVQGRASRFVQNLVLVDGAGSMIRTIQVPPITRAKSYLVDLTEDGGQVYVTDFRGYRYTFDIETEMVSPLDHIEKF